MQAQRKGLRALVACLAVPPALLLTGCQYYTDPLTNPDLWHADHANRANLTMQVANPADLVRGSAASTSNGQLAAAAVDRLLTEKVKALPQSDVANIGSGANNQNAPSQ